MYESIFLFPKYTNGMLTVIPYDCIKNERENNIIADINCENEFCVWNIILNSIVLNNIDAKEGFLFGLIVGLCDDNKERNKEYIHVKNQADWFDPFYFVRIGRS